MTAKKRNKPTQKKQRAKQKVAEQINNQPDAAPEPPPWQTAGKPGQKQGRFQSQPRSVETLLAHVRASAVKALVRSAQPLVDRTASQRTVTASAATRRCPGEKLPDVLVAGQALPIARAWLLYISTHILEQRMAARAIYRSTVSQRLG